MRVTSWNWAVTSLILAVLVAAVCGHPVASAQPAVRPTVYNSELTGWQVEAAGPAYALHDAQLEEYPHGRGERIAIHHTGELAFAEVAFFDDADQPGDTVAIMMREFESTSMNFAIIASGEVGNVSYSLARFQLNRELSGYVYIEVARDITGTIDLAQSLYTLNLDFPRDLAIARGEISINGQPFLAEPVIDITATMAADLEANPMATPAQLTYAFESADSVIEVHPPVSLDFDSQANGLESVNVSTRLSFGIIGYQQQEAEQLEDVLASIFADAPRGEEAPVPLHLDSTVERVVAVYRIEREGGTTIMVIRITAASPGLWRIEAVAGSEEEIVSELEVFQHAIVLDGRPFLDGITVSMLADIVNNNDQP